MDPYDGLDIQDQRWRAVADAIRSLSGADPAAVFGNVIRRSIDEVLDGPRTGRWSFDQLEKTEKTYVGTKLEIVLRTELGLDRGPVLDLEIEDQPVDVKWAMDSAWQIPQEAVGRLCLCIGGLRRMTRFQVGVVRCRAEYLNVGQNRDRKRTLSARGRAAMTHLVLPTPIPTNFVAEMDPSLRSAITEEETIQARVTKLFLLLPRTAVPRSAIATVARTTGDPMRRVRVDSQAGDPLAGMQILSAKYGNSVLEALGYPRLGADEFMSVPKEEIDAIPETRRRALPPAARKRLRFD
jgi:Restriction endonuclease NaeI